MSDAPTLTIQTLETLLNRIRSAQPARGREARLAPDAAVLGGLYGRMIHRNLMQVPRTALEPEELAAWARWSEPDPTSGV